MKLARRDTAPDPSGVYAGMNAGGYMGVRACMREYMGECENECRSVPVNLPRGVIVHAGVCIVNLCCDMEMVCMCMWECLW